MPVATTHVPDNPEYCFRVRPEANNEQARQILGTANPQDTTPRVERDIICSGPVKVQGIPRAVWLVCSYVLASYPYLAKVRGSRLMGAAHYLNSKQHINRVIG